MQLSYLGNSLSVINYERRAFYQRKFENIDLPKNPNAHTNDQFSPVFDYFGFSIKLRSHDPPSRSFNELLNTNRISAHRNWGETSLNCQEKKRRSNKEEEYKVSIVGCALISVSINFNKTSFKKIYEELSQVLQFLHVFFLLSLSHTHTLSLSLSLCLREVSDKCLRERGFQTNEIL